MLTFSTSNILLRGLPPSASFFWILVPLLSDQNPVTLRLIYGYYQVIRVCDDRKRQRYSSHTIYHICIQYMPTYILSILAYYVTDRVMLYHDKYYLRSDIHIVDLSKNHRTLCTMITYFLWSSTFYIPNT